MGSPLRLYFTLTLPSFQLFEISFFLASSATHFVFTIATANPFFDLIPFYEELSNMVSDFPMPPLRRFLKLRYKVMHRPMYC